MRNETRKILTDGLMNAPIVSLPQPLDNLLNFSVQAVWVGTTPVGTIGVQASNLPNPQVAADWTLLSAPAAVTGDSGSIQVNVENAGFRWMRVVYGFTSGTGTLQVYFNGKGGS